MSATREDVSPGEMAAAIEANVVETLSLFGRAPGTELHADVEGLRFYVTEGVPFPLFNHVYLTRLPAEEAEAWIPDLKHRYAARGLPFAWSVGPFTRPPDLGRRLESHGLARAERLTGMAADLRAVNAGAPSPAGLTVERVGDVGTLEAYAGVARVGFGIPGFGEGPLVGALGVLGLAEGSPFGHYVGRLGGRVVATASLSLAAGVAGVYNVATLPEARGRGFGTALTLAAVREARERGYRICALQSSDAALGVYARLGFERYSTYALYVGTGPG